MTRSDLHQFGRDEPELENSLSKQLSSQENSPRDLQLDPTLMPLSENGMEDFYWPVSRDEMEQFRDKVQHAIFEALRTGLSTDTSDWPLIRILYLEFLLDVMRIFQCVAVRSRSEGDGRQLQSPEEYRLFTALDNNESPPPRKLAWLLRGYAPAPSWKIWLRKLRDLIPFGTFRRRAVKGVSSDLSPIAMTTSAFMERHANNFWKTNGRQVALCSFWEWFVADESDRSDIDRAKPVNPDIVENLLSISEEAFVTHGEILPSMMRQYLADWLAEAGKSIRFFHNRLLENPDQLPRTLWYGSTNHVLTRTLRSATQINGGVCVGHDHGRGIGLCPNIGEHSAVLDLCNEYVSYSSSQSTWFAALDKAHPDDLVIPDSLNFSALPGIFPPAPAIRRAENAVSRDKQAIMYVAPRWLGEDVNLNCLPADAVYADWQARLLGQLHSWGNRILYKAHPECPRGMPESFERDFSASEVTGYIEEEYARADIFIIDFLSSSFRTIVYTGKPIVFINFGFGVLADEARAVLSKRCAIVDGWFDQDNRANVDWDVFQKALSLASECADDTSCARILFGGGND